MVTLRLAPEMIARLRSAAEEAASRAYAPYSNFHVGAALLFDDGAVITGCNVENVSYGLTSCAERNALFRAISESGAGRKIVAVAVANQNHAPSPPCGACRQVLAEFAHPDTMVFFQDGAGMTAISFAELFPLRFTLEGR